MTIRGSSLPLAGLALLGLGCFGQQPPAGLTQVQTVYLLPMANGMDNYLASQLTRLGVFQVVTDPLKADAVFTERLGEGFETRLKELYPEPPPEDEKKKEDSEEEADSPKEENFVHISSFGRGRGTIFLVDRRARQVVWSAYERPKNSTPDELDKTALRIARKLSKLLGKKQ